MRNLLRFNKKNTGTKNQLGLTLIELMIVIGIMALISATFYINVNISSTQQVKDSTEELMSNLRQVRNMVVAKAVYKFSGEATASYPVGGYGVSFDGVSLPARYFVYADKTGGVPGYQANQGDEIIGSVVTLPSNFVIINKVDEDKDFYFAMADDKQVVTDLAVDADKKFVATVRWPGQGGSNGYEGDARLGEQTSDGFVIANFGAVYNVYTPPPSQPKKGGGGKWNEF